MTKNDVTSLFKLIIGLFPASANVFGQADAITRDAWYEMLRDENPGEVAAALKVYAATATFAPSIGELRQTLARLKNPALQIDFDEAWGMVLSAMKKFGWSREHDALKALPDSVARCVKNIGWQEMCCSEDIGVLRGQFRAMYQAQAVRDKERAAMPKALSEQIKALAAANFKAIEQPKAQEPPAGEFEKMPEWFSEKMREVGLI